MATTKIVNGTDWDVDLREGQAGIYRKLGIIKKGGKFPVTSNVNATYKEYLCASANGKSQVILSSDDLNEWKELVIKSDGDTAKWEGVTRRQKTAGTADANRCSIM